MPLLISFISFYRQPYLDGHFHLSQNLLSRTRYLNYASFQNTNFDRYFAKKLLNVEFLNVKPLFIIWQPWSMPSLGKKERWMPISDNFCREHSRRPVIKNEATLGNFRYFPIRGLRSLKTFVKRPTPAFYARNTQFFTVFDTKHVILRLIALRARYDRFSWCMKLRLVLHFLPV